MPILFICQRHWRRTFVNKVVRMRGVFILLIALFSPVAMGYERLTLGSATYYYQGDYGLEMDTYTVVQQFSAKYQSNAWSTSLTVPLLYQDGPAYIGVFEEGATEDPNDNPNETESVLVGYDLEREQRWGVGDPTVSASYRWPKRSRNGRWTVTGTYKAPLANEEEGLSNGRHEISSGLSRSWRYQYWMFHGRLGVQWREAKTDYDNSARIQASVGTLYFLSNRSALGLSAYQRTSLSGDSEAIKTLSMQARYRLTRDWQLGANIGKGLTDSASNLFAGIQFSYAQKWR